MKEDLTVTDQKEPQKKKHFVEPELKCYDEFERQVQQGFISTFSP